MTHVNTETYLQDLRLALELRDAHEDHILDVLRQVRSHLSDSGEDPYDAFGDPREYAKQFSPVKTTTRFWVLIIVSVILTVIGGWLLVNGLIHAVGGESMAWGLPPAVGIVVGSILLATWIALLVVSAAGWRSWASRRP